MPNSARAIVRDVIPRRMADEIWSARYDKALPISFNAFELSAVLPVGVLHVPIRAASRPGRVSKDLRTGRRVPSRNDGGQPPWNGLPGSCRPAPTSTALAAMSSRAILGDLLLCFLSGELRSTILAGTSRFSGLLLPTTWRAGSTSP